MDRATRSGAGNASIGSSAHFRDLLNWYRPYLRGCGPLLTFTLGATATLLACQAVTPLAVSSLLSEGTFNPRGVSALVAVIIGQLSLTYLSGQGAARIAARSERALRTTVFAKLLTTRGLGEGQLIRSSIVSRHTSDVDHISDAFEATLTSGLPATLRIGQSLVLLTIVEWWAGLTMTLATIAFLVLRRKVGDRLLVADRERLNASTGVAEMVDETVSAARGIAGLGLEPWLRGRFAQRAHTLEAASRAQSQKVTMMTAGASATGLAGMVIVVLAAVTSGGAELAAVAASLLYVDAIVRSLEALPRWVRSLHLAVVCRRRVDQILVDPHTLAADPLPVSEPVWSLLCGDVASAAAGRLVGLVTPDDLEAEDVLAIMSATAEASSWRLSLDRRRMRMPGVKPDVMHVPDETSAFNVSVRDFVAATAPQVTDEQIEELLGAVGLADITTLTCGLGEPLGPLGASLTANERQRLHLAVALAARPRVLLVGPLIALADADSAAPLLSALRAARPEVAVMSVRNPDLASQLDEMLFVDHDATWRGTHPELLHTVPRYAQLWERRLRADGVDLSFLGLDERSREAMGARMITEQYGPGELIYRQGSPADRVVFLISGHVEISVTDPRGEVRRVAVLGPGTHCGDLRLTGGELRAETARALGECVVRSLSVGALAGGMTGMLERTELERRMMVAILRQGSATAAGLRAHLADVDDAQFDACLDRLLREGAVRGDGDALRVTHQRRNRVGARELLDRLGDL